MYTAVVRIELCVRNDKLPGSTMAERKIGLDDTIQYGLSLLLLQHSNDQNCILHLRHCQFTQVISLQK